MLKIEKKKDEGCGHFLIKQNLEQLSVVNTHKSHRRPSNSSHFYFNLHPKIQVSLYVILETNI